MNRLLSFTSAIILLLGTAYFADAQTQQRDTSYWKKLGVTGLNLSQAAMSNWAAGGEPAFAADANFSYSMDYEKENNLWKNRLELAYGFNNTKTNGYRKTNDKIYLASNYGYKFAGEWYVSTLLTFETQFSDGYKYDNNTTKYVSTFMAPGYLNFGPGVTWKPLSWLNVVISPATIKMTFVQDQILADQGAYGVDPGKNSLFEFGGNVNVELKKEIFENMVLYSRLSLFTNYLNKPQNIDIKWDNQLSMNINKWLSAVLQFNLIYDDDIKFEQPDGSKVSKLQLKEVLGIGVQFKF